MIQCPIPAQILPLSEGSSRPRKHRLDDRQKRYKEGSRKAYKTQKDLDDSFEKSDIPDVCDVCTPALKQIKETFKVLKHQGTELKKRKNQLPHPKRPDREHYQNLTAQNEWLRANILTLWATISIVTSAL